MSEVKNYASDPCNSRFLTWVAVKHGGSELGEVVIAQDFDRVTAERDASLRREAALREDLDNHDSASQLMNAWVSEKGQMPWVTAINIVAIVTKMPDEERQRLIDMDYGSTERGTLIAKIDALQQRLTAADERADVLEGLLRHVSGRGRVVNWELGLMDQIDDALKGFCPACNGAGWANQGCVDLCTACDGSGMSKTKSAGGGGDEN